MEVKGAIMDDSEDDLLEEEYSKIIGQYRGELRDLLQPLTMYGQGDYVVAAIEQLVILGTQLHYKLCGIDIPYEIERPHY